LNVDCREAALSCSIGIAVYPQRWNHPTRDIVGPASFMPLAERCLVNLAKALGLKVVAEGVQTEGQRRILREFGCDQSQGTCSPSRCHPRPSICWLPSTTGRET